MTKQEYEQKKIESWEKYDREVLKVKWQNRFSVFCDAFDRAYTLGKLEKDPEGEEMLTVSRKRVQKAYNECDRYFCFEGMLEDLFGSKCLPDKEPKPAEPKFKVGDKVRILSLHGSPTPDNGVVDVIAHINKGNRKQMYYLENHYHCAFGFSESDLEPYTEPKKESRNLSQETANCDKQFDNILKDSFRNERRLNIAAMAMQGILSNQHMRYLNPVAIADYALAYADVLIKQSEIN